MAGIDRTGPTGPERPPDHHGDIKPPDHSDLPDHPDHPDRPGRSERGPGSIDSTDHTDTGTRRLRRTDIAMGHILNEYGWDTEHLTDRHDPAQTDPTKRTRMLDATKPGTHYCADKATAIKDPTAFAAAFTRGIEHPKVRAALDCKDLDTQFDPVEIPIVELLGPDGHKDCVGYRLVPVNGDLIAAKRYRDVWATKVARGQAIGSPPPAVEPIVSFEGGTIKFVFRPDLDRAAWTVLTMYPELPEEGKP